MGEIWHNLMNCNCRYTLVPVGGMLSLLPKAASRVVHMVLGLYLMKKCFIPETFSKTHLSFHGVQQCLRNSNASSKDKHFWGDFLIVKWVSLLPFTLRLKWKWKSIYNWRQFFNLSTEKDNQMKVHMGRIRGLSPICTHHCKVIFKSGWEIVLSTNSVAHELYFSLRWPEDT